MRWTIQKGSSEHGIKHFENFEIVYSSSTTPLNYNPMALNLTDFWKYFVRFLRDRSIKKNFLKDRKYNSQRMEENGPSRLPAQWTAFSVYWSGETEERTLN